MVRFGVVSGVTSAVVGCGACAVGAGCGAAGWAVLAAILALALASPAGGGFGAKKYCHPKSIAIDKTAAIKKRDWLLGLLLFSTLIIT